jgi:hypothetical protein
MLASVSECQRGRCAHAHSKANAKSGTFCLPRSDSWRVCKDQRLEALAQVQDLEIRPTLRARMFERSDCHACRTDS